MLNVYLIRIKSGPFPWEYYKKAIFFVSGSRAGTFPDRYIYEPTHQLTLITK